MADTEKVTTETKKTIRSLLISCKDGLSLYHLERDHKELMGCPVPFKKLGYYSCADMLASMQDVCRKTFDKTGAEVYKAVADESTAHIAALVLNQRSKKPKKGKGRKFSSTSRRPMSTYSFQASSRYNPSYLSHSMSQRLGHNFSANHRPPSYPTRDHNISHPVHTSSRWPSGHSGSVRGGYRPITGQTTVRNQSSAPPTNSNTQVTSLAVTIKNRANPSRRQTEKEVRANMEEVLRAYPGGVWLHMLSDMYLGLFGLNFPSQYKDSIMQWTDLIDAQKMHGKDILYMATDESRRVAGSQQALNQTPSLLSSAPGSSDDLDLFVGEIQSPVTFYIGETCQVYVSYVVQENFTIYVQREESTINSFTSELKDHYNSSTLKTYTRIPPRCVCAAKDSTFNAWSRATVTKTECHSKAQLFYVDFGNTEIKSISDMQPLPKQFLSLPSQANAVRLGDITSDNLVLLSKEFDSLAHLQRLQLKCESIEGGVCSVVLWDINDPSITISSKLVSLGLATWVHGSPRQDNHTKPTKSTNPSISPIRAPSHQAPVPVIEILSSDSSFSTESSGSTLPESDYWTVIITHILSPSSLYVRIKNPSIEEFYMLQEEAPQAYNNAKPVSLLVIGDLYMAYVAFEDDGPGYYRVRASTLLDSKTVECEFIDYGFQHSVDRMNMYPITIDKHIQIPYQARLCTLYGMDQVGDDNERVIAKLEELTDDKTLVAQVISVERGIPHIVLFDTSGDDDLEINKELGSVLEDEVLKAALPPVGETIDVTLVYIESDGTLYVQPIGPANLLLQNLMKEINEYYSKQNTTSEDFVTNPQEGQLVCAKYEGTWYRATLTKVLPNRKVTVFYGDYGNSATVQTTQLRKLPVDVQHINSLPMQGLACKLSGLHDWNDDVGLEAAHLMQEVDYFVLMTVKEGLEDEPTRVQLTHANIHLNNHLLKIYEESRIGSTPTSETPNVGFPLESQKSDSLDSQEQMSPGTPPGSPPDESISAAATQPDGRAPANLTVSGAGDYVAEKLDQLHLKQEAEEKYKANFVSPPDVGEYWDVFVTTTNAPDHFVVVSLLQIKLLNELVDRMHNEYKDSPVVEFEPKEGELCAGFCTDDNYWYRVLVMDKKIGDKYQVIFADYGNYEFLSIHDMRPLRNEYKEMQLQAVRAGLCDVIPAVGNMWTAEAQIAFIELCNEKKLVSKIRHIDRSKNLLSQGPSVLFELYDTTQAQEINIDEELVNRGHAIFK